jgi:hypothetical protein
MDADRRDEALTGPELDREIREALAVNPSPEFVARVRTRIASEPARRTSWLSWQSAAVVAIAAVIAIAVVVSRPRKLAPVVPADRTPLQARTVAPFSQIVFVASDLSRTRFAVASGFGRTMTRSAKAFALQRREIARSAGALLTVRLKPDATEVLLDPAETRALQRLIAGTRDGTIDLSASLQATTPAAMDLAPLSEIVIPFLTIDPITPQPGEEGVRP